MLLILDNYDSFTYNLAQYLGEMGQQLEVRRNDRITLDEIAARLEPAIETLTSARLGIAVTVMLTV